MAYSQELIAKVRRLHFYEHYTIHAVSQTVKLHRDTVRRILYGDMEASDGKMSISILDPYKEVIDSHLEQYPSIRATKIYQLLVDRGYKGSISTVRRFVRGRRKKRGRGYRPLSFFAGEQAQVDWAHFGSLKVAGGERKLYLFVMVLSYSRAIYAEFTFDSKTDSFLRLHERAFIYFGGVPRKLLYDNLKSAVAERCGNTIRYNQFLLEFSGFYGFVPAACQPYSGNQKGRVERAIRYIRESFFEGYTPEHIQEANRDLKKWLNKTANKRPWPDGKESCVSKRWKEEKAFLQTPTHSHGFKAKYSQTVKSSKHGLIRFDLNDYSIPMKYQRLALTLEADDEQVYIFSNEKLIANHYRSWERGQRVLNRDHWQQNVDEKKQQFRFDQILHEVPQLESNLRILVERGEQKAAICRQFNALRKLFGDEMFCRALSIAQESEKYHPEQLKRTLKSLEAKGNKPTVPFEIKNKPELSKFDVKSHSLDIYDIF